MSQQRAPEKSVFDIAKVIAQYCCGRCDNFAPAGTLGLHPEDWLRIMRGGSRFCEPEIYCGREGKLGAFELWNVGISWRLESPEPAQYSQWCGGEACLAARSPSHRRREARLCMAVPEAGWNDIGAKGGPCQPRSPALRRMAWWFHVRVEVIARACGTSVRCRWRSPIHGSE